eukprot:287350_1
MCSHHQSGCLLLQFIIFTIIIGLKCKPYIFPISTILMVHKINAVTHWTYLGDLPGYYNDRVMSFWNDTLFLFRDGNLSYTPFILDIINWDKVQISTLHSINWTQIPLPPIANNYTTGCCDTMNAASQQYTQINNLLYGQWQHLAQEMITFDLNT